MANRRGIGAAMLGISAFLDEKDKEREAQNKLILQQQQEQYRQMALEKQRADDARQQAIWNKILSDPTMAQTLHDRGVSDPSRVGIDDILPTQGQLLGQQADAIGKADNLSALGTPDDYLSQFQAKGGQSIIPSRPVASMAPVGQIAPPSFGAMTQDPVQRIRQLYDAKAALLQAQVPATAVKNIDPRTGQETNTFVPSNQTSSLDPQVVGLGAADKGRLEGVSLVNKTPFTIASENAVNRGTQASAAAKAGATAFAQGRGEAAGAAPFHPTMLEDPTTGTTAPVTFGPDGMHRVDNPDGLVQKGVPVPGQKLKPTQTIVANNAQGNTAELKGVQILTALHNAGLEDSNDWASPKATQFLIGTLGVAPSDVMTMDVNQRANYIQAVLLRTLLAGRPSAYLAEVYGKHLPSAGQSPKLLAHQLKLALDENATNRHQLQNTYDLPEPTGGMTLDEYLKQAGSQQSAAQSKLQQLRGGS